MEAFSCTSVEGGSGRPEPESAQEASWKLGAWRIGPFSSTTSVSDSRSASVSFHLLLTAAQTPLPCQPAVNLVSHQEPKPDP